jgi:hypothetical protein
MQYTVLPSELNFEVISVSIMVQRAVELSALYPNCKSSLMSDDACTSMTVSSKSLTILLHRDMARYLSDEHVLLDLGMGYIVPTSNISEA